MTVLSPKTVWAKRLSRTVARDVTRGSRVTSGHGWSGSEWLANYLLASEVWKNTLGRYVDPVDNFYRAGGTADRVASLLDAWNEVLPAPITRQQFDDDPTLIDSLRRSGGGRCGEIVALRPGGTRPPLFLIAGSGGVGLQFAALTKELDSAIPVVAIQSRSAQRRRLPEYSLRAQARRVATLIDAIAPTGELAVGGHSFGGLVALGAALELTRRGRRVRDLIIIDTRPEGRFTRHMAGVPTSKHPLHLSRPVVPTLLAAGVAGLVRPRGGRLYQAQYLLGQVRRGVVAPLPPFDGTTHLVLTRHDPEYIEEGWRRRGAPLNVIPVGGSHNSCLRPPHVEFMAARLNELLGE
jgi:thioesterase domain-containing protein